MPGSWSMVLAWNASVRVCTEAGSSIDPYLEKLSHDVWGFDCCVRNCMRCVFTQEPWNAH